MHEGLENFIAKTGVDELMITTMIYDHTARLRSFELAAEIFKKLSVAVVQRS